jgi:acyl carrier protein phosphodiesterase
MNYLAHAYLSFGIPEITVGNLISDFVKGRKKLDYPPMIQKGIALHRAIDNFTDTHDTVRQAKAVFKDAYRLYAGPLVDVAFDHFLANDPLIFSEESLKVFAQKTYEQVSAHQQHLPEPFGRFFYYMRTQDWLFNYRYKQGILNSFAGLSRRAAYMGSADEAGRLFEEHYEELQTCYTTYFPLLQEFALRTLQQLQKMR